MKKYVLLLIILIVSGLVTWEYMTPYFPVQKILSQSKFKGRTFKGKVEEVSGLNGKLNAYLMEEHSIPLVAVSFGFEHAGSAYVAKDGVTLLLENTITDGAGIYNRKQLRELMREKGINLSVVATRDRLNFNMSYVKEFEADALRVLKAVLYEPKLDTETMRLVRQQLKAVKKQQSENPTYQLQELVRKEFYGKHPYGKETLPNDEILAQVTARDIRKYMHDYLTKDTLKIGFAGDIDKAEAEAFMVQAFGNLKDKAVKKELKKLEISGDDKKQVSLTSAQSFVMINGNGINRHDKDFYPLYIADYVFGGAGLTSRLSQSVREKEGLTYGIYSSFSETDALKSWGIYFSATPENVEKIKAITTEQYRKFYLYGITADELELAQKSLMSSFNLRFAGLINIAEMLKVMQIYDLGRDFLNKRQSFIKRVTLQEVNEAIRNKMPKSLEVKDKINIYEITGKKIINHN